MLLGFLLSLHLRRKVLSCHPYGVLIPILALPGVSVGRSPSLHPRLAFLPPLPGFVRIAPQPPSGGGSRGSRSPRASRTFPQKTPRRDVRVSVLSAPRLAGVSVYSVSTWIPGYIGPN